MAFDTLSEMKIRIDDTSVSDDLLLSYIGEAEEVILNWMYPFGIPEDVTEVPAQYQRKVLSIAIYLFNKRGAEGQISHSENGISRTYESADVPLSMLRGITRHVGVRG